MKQRKKYILKKHTDTKHPKQPKVVNQEQDKEGNGDRALFYWDKSDYSSKSKKSLKKHTFREHDDQKTISQKSGQECEYDFTSENNLEDHINEMHMKDRDNSNLEHPEVDAAELDEWIARAEAENQLKNK